MDHQLKLRVLPNRFAQLFSLTLKQACICANPCSIAFEVIQTPDQPIVVFVMLALCFLFNISRRYCWYGVFCVDTTIREIFAFLSFVVDTS